MNEQPETEIADTFTAEVPELGPPLPNPNQAVIWMAFIFGGMLAATIGLYVAIVLTGWDGGVLPSPEPLKG